MCVDSSELYSLKQAPHAWYAKIDIYLTILGFAKSEADANFYDILAEGKLLIIALYVNDLILTGDEKLIKYCKEDLVRIFEIKDMGLMHTSSDWKYGKVMGIVYLSRKVCQQADTLEVLCG